MKKSSKPMILFVLFYFITATLFVLGYVGIKLQCEILTKKKVLARQELSKKENWELNLIAQKQSLIGEERIVNIAQNELGMIRQSNTILTLYVDKEKIKTISEEIKDKYE